MTPKLTKRISVPKSKRADYAMVGDNFYKGAEVAREFDYYNAAGVLIVHAAIAYTDSITIKFGGVKSKGEDHMAAVELLRQVMALDEKGLAGARHLERIINEKNRVSNDNDPRLGTAFSDLSPEAKNLFRSEYRQLPAERRNELGTVVYLLGRNLKTEEDWAFMRDVVTAPPCLSLANCSREVKAGPDSLTATGAEITLSYPAIMALKRAERMLQAGREDGAQELQLIAVAKSSRSKIVSDMAAKMEQQYSRP
jgi:hypothetical protein